MPTKIELRNQLEMQIRSWEMKDTAELKAAKRLVESERKRIESDRQYRNAVKTVERLEAKQEKKLKEFQQRHETLKRKLVVEGPSQELAIEIFKLKDDWNKSRRA